MEGERRKGGRDEVAAKSGTGKSLALSMHFTHPSFTVSPPLSLSSSFFFNPRSTWILDNVRAALLPRSYARSNRIFIAPDIAFTVVGFIACLVEDQDVKIEK